MNKAEARAILREKLASYRKKPHGELATLIGQEPETGEVIGPNGESYQFEIQAFWDSRPDGDIRVIGDICECPHKPRFWNIPLLRWIPLYSSDVIESFIVSDTHNIQHS